LRGKP